jgi:hypothetical protein
MPRLSSGDGWDCPTWPEGVDPGAGSQDFDVFDDKGLNGWHKRVWRGLKLNINPDGTFKDSIINYNHLLATVADASSIELGGSPAKLRIKAGGVTGAMLNANVADDVTIEYDEQNDYLSLKALGVTGPYIKQTGTGKIVDATTIEFFNNELRVKDDGITPAKISHDNTRTRAPFMISFNATDGAYYINGIPAGTTLGIKLGTAGSLVGCHWSKNNGTSGGAFKSYAAQLHTFAAGAILSMYNNGAYHYPIVNGSELDASGDYRVAKDVYNVNWTLLVEFDDA